jgi:hypothetical protein
MPLLGFWIGSLMTSLASFFSLYISKKVALTAAAITLFLALTGAMLLALKGAIQAVYVVAPPELAIAVGWLVPDNVGACFAAIMTAKFIRFVYDYQVQTIKIASWV